MDINRMRIRREDDLRRKLSEEAIDEIKVLRASGESYEKIGIKYGVSTSTIYGIFNLRNRGAGGKKDFPSAAYNPEKYRRSRDRKKTLLAQGKLIIRDVSGEEPKEE